MSVQSDALFVEEDGSIELGDSVEGLCFHQALNVFLVTTKDGRVRVYDPHSSLKLSDVQLQGERFSWKKPSTMGKGGRWGPLHGLSGHGGPDLCTLGLLWGDLCHWEGFLKGEGRRRRGEGKGGRVSMSPPSLQGWQSDFEVFPFLLRALAPSRMEIGAKGRWKRWKLVVVLVIQEGGIGVREKGVYVGLCRCWFFVLTHFFISCNCRRLF